MRICLGRWPQAAALAQGEVLGYVEAARQEVTGNFSPCPAAEMDVVGVRGRGELRG